MQRCGAAPSLRRALALLRGRPAELRAAPAPAAAALRRLAATTTITFVISA